MHPFSYFKEEVSGRGMQVSSALMLFPSDPTTITTLIVIGLFCVKYDEMNEMLLVRVRKRQDVDHITNVLSFVRLGVSLEIPIFISYLTLSLPYG